MSQGDIVLRYQDYLLSGQYRDFLHEVHLPSKQKFQYVAMQIELYNSFGPVASIKHLLEEHIFIILQLDKKVIAENYYSDLNPELLKKYCLSKK